MNKIDLAVIGSGIGGSLISILNKDKDLVLFEKDKNLGGTASTFKRFGNYFNSGATTFVGYEDNHILKDIFDIANFTPDLIESSYAYRTIIDGKIIDRKRDFEEFLESLNTVFYHKNNRYFWQTLKDIDAIIAEVNYDELYANGVLINDLDKYLSSRDFIRVDSNSIKRGYGDALYVKKKFCTYS